METVSNNMPPVAGLDDRRVLEERWAALGEAARTIGLLAGFTPQDADPRQANLPAQLQQIAPWRREIATRHMVDIVAMLLPGLTALLTIHARGLETAAPARALLREFYAACDTIYALLPETGAHQRH